MNKTGKPKIPTTAHTLRDQLAPVAAKFRETRSWVRPVSQVLLRLKALPSKDRFTLTIQQALRWMDNRAGKRLPDLAWEHRSFQMEEVGAQRVAAVALEGYWTARLDDADKQIPQRTWITEIGIGLLDDGDVLFGCRLICATRGAEKPMLRSVPGFVRGVFDDGPVEIDGFAVRPDRPRFIDTEDDIDELIDFLESPLRRVPVVALSLPEGSSNQDETLIPANELARSVAGAACVVILSSKASFIFTDRAGKELSVFRQAVRIYQRDFNRRADQASRHPLTLPERARAWRAEDTDSEGISAYIRWLVDFLLAVSVQRTDREDELPSFNAVRQKAAQIERKKLSETGGSQAELLKLFEEDNLRLANELREERERLTGQLIAAEEERDQAREQINELRSQAFDLRERINVLHERLNKAADRVPKAQIPGSLDEFETWCREHLSGVVTLHNRAFRGIQKSKYEQPKLIYQALLLLRDHYVPMRRTGNQEHKQAFEKGCRELQLEDNFVGEATKTHSEQYTINYEGRPRILDRHLKRGKLHDERRSFRLYYFWDEETNTVVVGWLPSHLDNSKS